MGKRREKRVATATGSNHRRDRHRTTDSAADSNPNRDRKLFILFVVFFIVLPAISLIVYTTLFASRTDTSLPNSHQPGLAKIDMNYLQVLTKFRRIQSYGRIHLTGILGIQYWPTLLHGTQEAMILQRHSIPSLLIYRLCGMT